MTLTAKKLAFAEYLTYCNGADTPHELVDGELIPSLGTRSLGTGKHADFAEFLNDEFRAQIRQMQRPWTSK